MRSTHATRATRKEWSAPVLATGLDGSLRRLGLLALCGCRIGFDPIGEEIPDPEPIPGASSSQASEENCTMSSTSTELIFTIRRDLSDGQDFDLYVMKRPTLASPWQEPEEIVELNTNNVEGHPRLSSDDRTLYFASNRAGGFGGLDIWVSTRSALGQPWQPPQHVAEVSSMGPDKWLSPCDGGNYVMIRNSAPFEGRLGAGPPTQIDELSTGGFNSSTFLTADCRTLYFASDRNGTNDLFETRRAAPGAPWSLPEVLTAYSTNEADEEDLWMSPDGHRLVYARSMRGVKDYDVFIAERE